MNKRFKTALIGCGTISYNHLTALAELDDVTVVALCDVHPERAEARKAEFELGAKIYTDFDELLEEEELDAVHIATPHYLHAPMTIAALEKGINVFLEKPLCISEAEADAMLAAEKNSSARVCVSFQNRFNAAFEYAKRLVESDGGATDGYGSVFWYRSREYYEGSDWRGRCATEGGGVMINQAIHTLDMLIQLLGKPTSVCATTANHHLKGVIDVEDSCEALIGFENGAQGGFYATTAFRGNDEITLVVKTKNHKLELRGARLAVDGAPVELATRASIGKDYYGGAHPIIIRKFYEAIADGLPMPVDMESARYSLSVLLAAYSSHDEVISI